MSRTDCLAQSRIGADERREARAEGRCAHCGESTANLILRGELLEVCADEFASDISTGERVLTAVALCPTCHRAHHLDANNRHNPCQIKARRSREGLE